MARFGRKAPEPEKAPELTSEVPAGWAARLAPPTLTDIARAGQEAGMLDVHVEAEIRAAYRGGRTFPTHDDEW